jgi:hypothetical protein
MIQSSEKIRPFFFGTRLKVLIMVFLALKTFDLVPKSVHSFLALDQKFLKALLRLSI